MIPVNEPLLSGNEEKYVRDCIQTAWISSAGKYIDRFENEWAKYCGRKHGVAVSNGTVALQLAIAALQLPAGKEVIIPTFTIVSCIEAVLRNNLVPVLVDSDPKNYCMNLDQLETKITDNSVAVMPVHIYGHPVDMDRLLKIASKYNLKVIEDAAEAHGSECLVDNAWAKCGSFGDVSTFSFYANKNISCGEGGMVLTDCNEIAENLKAMRNLCFGRKERFKHESRGWNFRLTNIQAAVGCAQLEQIDSFVGRKLEMASMYSEGLKNLPLQLPEIEEWAKTSVWMYAVLLDDSIPYDAVEFAEKMMAEGVQTRPFFLGMHAQPAYLELGLFENESYPVADEIYKKGVYLPSGQAITDEQIDSVIKATRKVLS